MTTSTKRFLALLLLVASSVGCLASSATAAGDRPSIGGTVVPRSLHCAEDEIIAFKLKAPRLPDGGAPLGCVHGERFAKRFAN